MYDKEINYLKDCVIRGDEQAYKKLFYLVFTPLKKFGCSLGLQPEPVEEIVSDVLIYVWRHKAQLDTIEDLTAYLYIAVKNRCLNFLQREQKNNHLSFDDLPTIMHNYTPEQSLISAQMRQQLQKAVSELPPRCRLCFQLVKEEGLSYKQVAGILNISVKTVDAQMVLAIKKLAQRITPILK